MKAMTMHRTRIWNGVLGLLAGLLMLQSSDVAAELRGFHWNGTAMELRRLDPSNGLTHVIGTVPGLAAIAPHAVAVNQNTGVGYVLGIRSDPAATAGAAGGVAGPVLFAFDAHTGAAISDRVLDAHVSTLHVRSDGALVGLSRTAGARELRQIDPSTGSTTLIAALPDIGAMLPAGNVFDRSTDELFQVGHPTLPVQLQGGGALAHLFVIDAQTGVMIRNVATDREFASLHLRNNGGLVGVASTGTGVELRSIDKITGVSTAFGPFFGLTTFLSASSALEPSPTEMVQIGLIGSSSTMVVLNPANGGLIRTRSTQPTLMNLFWLDVSAVAVEPPAAPHVFAFALMPARPNPFLGSTRIEYTLDRAGPVSLTVIDVAGRVVKQLAAGTREAGKHTIAWNGLNGTGRPVSSGTYFVTLRSLGREITRKVVYMN